MLASLFLQHLRNQRRIVVYGAGNNGKFLLWLLKTKDIHIDYVVDRCESLWGQYFYGVKCVSPNELVGSSELVVILSIVEYDSVLTWLDRKKAKEIWTWPDIRFLWEYPSFIQDYLLASWETEKPSHKMIKKNKKYRNIHCGKRCFIIGNGPSIARQDLSLLKNEVTFTVNQMARSEQFSTINTQYHIWADPNFFRITTLHEGEYRLLELMKSMPSHTECFFPYDAAERYIQHYELDKYININYYLQHVFVDYEHSDFSRYIKSPYTVVHVAIQLAIYMGFKQIYLLGCECTTILNVINAKTQNYQVVTHGYSIDSCEKRRAKEMYDLLPMQRYYESEIKVLNDYELLYKYCISNNVSLINCTDGGLLETIPRVDYMEILDAR